MTSSVNYPNQQFPAYSGVTINISNPTVNAGCPNNMLQSTGIQTENSNNLSAAPVTNPIQYQIQPQQQTVETQDKTTPQAYPPQYYLNNYNIQGNGKDMLTAGAANNPNNVDSSTALKNTQDTDMSSSNEIISDLDSRANEQKELEKNGKQKRVIALTNEYIMSLENYLNNPNTEIRLMAAKEILTRLDEDKERYDDAALNALLNKMLQDPEKLVRIAALSAFSSQLASGNDYTVKLLTDIQTNPESDKEDVIQAADILLKMSASTKIKYTPVQTLPEENKKAEE